MIRILSDSTCDLSPELVERYHLTIIPLHVLLGDEDHLDGVDVDQKSIYAWADANKTTPHTAGPSVEEILDFFRPIIENGDEIICFSISESMSNSLNVLKLAVQILDAEDKISLINSANLSTGIGLQILHAADMVNAGKTRQEIVEELARICPKVRASFVIDTLTYLYRGGRCSGVAALMGGMLKLHPEIIVRDGAMSPSKKYRGKMNSVYLSYAKDLEEAMKNAYTDRVFVTHTCQDEEGPQAVVEYVKSLGIFDEVLETHAGGVVASHCGPGTLGVLFISKE
ncbi:MAG: DegV family protein [Lachnospiraceae bacterium]|nr:DegV family protein [Lachnospiraceae bacterium]